MNPAKWRSPQLTLLKLDKRVTDVYLLDFAATVSFALLLAGSNTGYLAPQGTYQATLRGMVLTYTFAVFREELPFRIVPWLLSYAYRIRRKNDLHSKKISWITGVVYSLVFGLLHLINFEYINLASVVLVLVPTISGFLLWYLVEKNGLFSSILVHLVSNATLWLIVMGRIALA